MTAQQTVANAVEARGVRVAENKVEGQVTITPYEAKRAEQRRLQAAIRDLQLQIEQNRDWWIGRKFASVSAYETWRSEMIGNLRYKQRAIVRIKNELAEMHRMAQLDRLNPDVDPSSAESLLSLAYRTLRELGRKVDWKLTEQQQAAIDVIADYLGR